MRAHQKRRGTVSGHVAKAVVAGVALVAGCVTIGGSAGASTSSAPGVTSSSITVGTISTQTGPIASNFSSPSTGKGPTSTTSMPRVASTVAKFDYKYALDDAGNVTTFNQLASTLINQDHVFAITGVATASVRAQLLRRGEDPDLWLQRLGQLGRSAQPVRGRWFGHLLPRRGP